MKVTIEELEKVSKAFGGLKSFKFHIEKLLHDKYEYCDLFEGKDGGTEFRFLSPSELKEALKIIEKS